MTATDPPSGAGTAGILISAESLFGTDPAAPRPLADAQVAIERLGWIGQPVVLVGDEIAGRRLPTDPDDRMRWVRTQLGSPDLAVVPFEEGTAGRSTDVATRLAVEYWSRLREDWQADRLVTGRGSSVGPARRAGLTVVRIGPRGSASGPSVERADHDARDLLDAVSRLMTADIFGGHSRG